MKIIPIVTALACLLSLTSCATREAQLGTLTKEHFRDTITIKDDSLDTVAEISTAKGFQERKGLAGVVWDDNFLRALVDKQTGQTRIQLYQIIYYQGDSWNFYHTINYETPEGPQSRPLVIIDRNVNCTFSRYGGCMYAEHVGLEVDERLLRFIAATYQPGQLQAWKFKFTAKSGREYRDGMLVGEVAGLLEALDGYRGRKGLVIGSPAISQYGNNERISQKFPATSTTQNANSETARVAQLLKDQGFPIVGDPVRFKQKGNFNFYEAKGAKGQVTQVICESGGACRLRTIHD